MGRPWPWTPHGRGGDPRCGLEEHPRGIHDLGRPANWFAVARLDARFLIVSVHGASVATDAPWTALNLLAWRPPAPVVRVKCYQNNSIKGGVHPPWKPRQSHGKATRCPWTRHGFGVAFPWLRRQGARGGGCTLRNQVSLGLNV